VFGSFVFAFVVLLGVLVFVHELGHFLVAKAVGVRVLKFSLGFGPTVGFGRFRMQWTRGHTEYVVAWIPLGGFVKMLGETGDETEDAVALANPDETLGSKKLWEKLAIVFAGPAMNLIFPVLVFVFMLAVGIQQPNATIGSVELSSPAAAAGLQSGDRLETIGGEPVQWWEDVAKALRDHPGEAIEVVYERDGESRTVVLEVGERSSQDEFGTVKKFGWAGIGHPRQRALIAIPDANAAALVAGLRSGDLVKTVDGVEVEDWQAFVTEYEAARGEVAIQVDRGELDREEIFDLTLPALGSTDALGAYSATVLIASVNEDSPARRGGLIKGDLVLSVNGETMGSFAAFSNSVKSSEGDTLELLVSRDGHYLNLSVTPELVPLPNGLPGDQYLVGVLAEGTSIAGSWTRDQQLNPLISVPRAVSMTVDRTIIMVRGVGKLLTGEVSSKQIAGPIGIAQIAGNALAHGWETYLNVMVLISINLGVLNLLPIPILDGGQALIFSIEGIRRAPLSMRMREVVQQIGLTFLFLLMGLAFWNDLSRQWDAFFEWVRSGTGL